MKNKLLMQRQKRGLSQEELAKISGVNRNTISQLENDDLKSNTITLKTLKALSKALKCNVTDIFFI